MSAEDNIALRALELYDEAHSELNKMSKAIVEGRFRDGRSAMELAENKRSLAKQVQQIYIESIAEKQ